MQHSIPGGRPRRSLCAEYVYSVLRPPRLAVSASYYKYVYAVVLVLSLSPYVRLWVRTLLVDNVLHTMLP
jgi:hypothetical protein